MKKLLLLSLSALLFSCNSNSLISDDTSFGTTSILSDDQNEQSWGNKVTQLPTSKEKKRFTLLSYLGFDNDKQSVREELSPVINTHELAGSSNILNQILFVDGSDETDIKRYYITHDANPQKIVSPYALSKRERNSGDYRTLAAFAKWGFSTYPSKIKILDINSHGAAYQGIVLDSTSRKVIPIPDFVKAIKQGAGKVDILNMDACLMSAVEVAYDLRGVAEIIVSSEDNTLSTGMNYSKHLNEILSNSSDDIYEIAKRILDKSDRIGASFDDYQKNNDLKLANVFTISAVTTKDLDRLAFHINKLSRMLLNKMTNYRPLIKTAFNKCHQLTINKLGDDEGQRDAFEVFARLEIELENSREAKRDSELMNAVKDVREDLRRVTLQANIHKSEPWAEGISINIFPSSVRSTDYQATSFAKDTLWDEMVIASGEEH